MTFTTRQDSKTLFDEKIEYDPDTMPFGVEAERRRIALEETTKDRRSLIHEIRARMFELEQQAIRRREGR